MAETLRLCTWNIQLGLQLDTILDALQTHADFRSLDLLALQEASIRDGQDDAETIACALGPSYESYQVTAHFLGRYVQANALIWNRNRVQVRHQDTVILPRVRELTHARAERAFLCALPQQQRISVVTDAFFGEHLLRFYVAHLDVLGLAHKRDQFFRILADAHARAPEADLTILAGDLNTFRIHSHPSWSRLSQAATTEGFQDLTSELRFTHHTFRPIRLKQKLDAVFVRARHPVHCRSWSLDIRGSDHIPVFAEITLS